MASRPWKWLVFFFTRPIRLSDLSAFVARIKPAPLPQPAPLPALATATTVPAQIEVLRPRPATTAPARAMASFDRPPARVASMLRPTLEVGVSEQPLDTLPADLRDELQRPATGRL